MSVRGPRTGDAFGALLLAALEAGGASGRVFDVVERDDGHVRVNDAARYLAPGMRSRFRDLATEWFDYLFLRVEDLADLLAAGRWRLDEHLHEGAAYAVRPELT